MTLSTLDINKLKKQSFRYLVGSIICFVFSMIYEHFSHNVYSNYMIYAFLIPLLMGFLISGLIYIIKPSKMPSNLSNSIYNYSVITLTFGSIISGILEIYGTTNKLIYCYLYIGILLLFISLIMYCINISHKIHN